MNYPLISVIIPVKNRRSQLLRSVNSVLNQNFQNFEVLIIDDYSEDDIESFVIEQKDDRIKYFKSNKRPSNANVCRNIGFKNAKGSYIAMLDSDDEWMPNHLESKMKLMEQTDADFVFGSYQVFDGTQFKSVVSRPIKEDEKKINYILGDGSAQTSSYFLRKSCCDLIEWDESLLRHQDLDFFVRFGNKFKLEACPEVTVTVYWIKGERRLENFDSTQKFIEKNKKDILPNIYNNYHRVIYLKIKDRKDIDSHYKKFYFKESCYYFGFVSWNDFITTYGRQLGSLKKIRLRLYFAFKVIFYN